MKLSRRIRDLVRAGLASPSQVSRLGKARSPARMEAQLEQIGKALAQAAGREKQIRDDLALAEEEGRERDAVRLRRQLADLAESTDELQKALDLIEARIEMERERETEAERRPSGEESLLAEETDSPQTSLDDEKREDNLGARKSRLAAPD
jgi:protein involved in polysaccharide export with SLBB domain